jgi:hypothetical protein
MDTDALADDVRRQLRVLRAEIESKAETRHLDRLRRELRSTEDTITGVEERVAGHEAALESLGRDLRAELEKAVANLDRRLRWLERYVRASDGAVTAPLDPDPELVELARRAEQGLLLEEELLDSAARSARTATVARWKTWQQDRHTHRVAAVVASRRIAGTAPGTTDRQQAVAAFRTARRELAILDERRDRVRDAATQAEEELALDDALRHTHAADIDRGRTAWTTLTTRLRTRLVDMIDKGHLPPVWFVTVLGMSPSRDAEAWLEVGTELLAYRVTYEITDPVVALGPDPDSIDSPDAVVSSRRRAWYRRLTNRFRDH